MRTSISKKNPYWLPKHRFLELRHFCLQFPEWEKELRETVFLPDDPGFDPTGEIAARIAKLSANCDLVKQCCIDSDRELWRYLFLSVTNGYSYDTMRARFHIPCGKDYFFIRWRKVYWLMSFRR